MSDLKLIIIDEISMVRKKIFAQVNTQLIQIMGVNEPFGGLPVIVFGDFNQLRPVKEPYVFF